MSVQAKVQRPVSSCLSPLQGLVAGQPHVRGAALQALDHSPAVNDGTGEGGMGSWVGGDGQLGGRGWAVGWERVCGGWCSCRVLWSVQLQLLHASEWHSVTRYTALCAGQRAALLTMQPSVCPTAHAAPPPAAPAVPAEDAVLALMWLARCDPTEANAGAPRVHTEVLHWTMLGQAGHVPG